METHCQLDQFKVLYQDDVLVAIHKPAGLLVHRSPIDRHETQFAVQMTRDQINQKVYPLHRLDKATSGLLLFALDPETARLMGKQFETHSIQKNYLAICRGWTPEYGEINHALKHKLDKLADRHTQTNKPPQEAITDFERLATTEVMQKIGKYESQRYSLLNLMPKTGRKHQLRRHLNHISYPIIGDVKYGDRHHNHFFNTWLKQHRLYLAATGLTFNHPQTDQRITLNAPLEASYQIAIQNLSWEKEAADYIHDS
ncbi:pseudouridine synthase [Hydrogenovibrio sp. 3SP14C1]|uniref:pseudouridine synthase n=1 Tax=Hydrogenovibrio sp. 3SP14C1 TaxID=3038774 RepID=UPI002417958D|nr:pseudouridine synthase [Hydrogenovibrio sp. 3SP14C1]MDG4812124.1 pseudouridine synthase [Hydrogenovibrio sp. 3SP14C1]